jgi:aspartate-semialdehyde dehydrogenase
MKQNKKFRMALVGTDSLQGKEIKRVLRKKISTNQNIKFFDPEVEEEYSKLTEFQGEPRVILPLNEEALKHIDLVFLAADKKINKKYGTLVSNLKFKAIDLSETFNTNTKIPVVVAGINDHIIRNENPRLIANPHPVTIVLSHLFDVLLSEFGLNKAISMILQPASAFGEPGIGELANQSLDIMNGAAFSKKVFKAQVAFNLLSQTGKTDECGFALKEKQVKQEISRVLDKKTFSLSLSIVQAPVFHTYSILSYIELDKKTDIQHLENSFKQSSYFKFLPPSTACPVSSVTVSGKEHIHVSQIKKEEAFPNSFWIWTVADNLTRGSALNAYEIAQNVSEFLIR